MSELDVYLPESKAAATVKGFITEPGSNTSSSARLRWFSPVISFRLLELNEGHVDSANTSPVCTSTIIPVDQRACCKRPAFSSSL